VDDFPIRNPSCDAREEPLTLALSPQGRGEGIRGLQRVDDFPIRNPSCDAREEPLTLALSPQGRGEGIRGSQRANDLPILNPSCDAHKPAVPGQSDSDFPACSPLFYVHHITFTLVW
jgi:hypothetical protein